MITFCRETHVFHHQVSFALEQHVPKKLLRISHKLVQNWTWKCRHSKCRTRVPMHSVSSCFKVLTFCRQRMLLLWQLNQHLVQLKYWYNYNIWYDLNQHLVCKCHPRHIQKEFQEVPQEILQCTCAKSAFPTNNCSCLASSLVTVLVLHKILHLPCKYPLVHKVHNHISVHKVPNLI